MFPFMYEGATHSKCIEVIAGEMPWCKTNNGKWGYCAPDGEFPCVNSWVQHCELIFLIEALCVVRIDMSDKDLSAELK